MIHGISESACPPVNIVILFGWLRKLRNIASEISQSFCDMATEKRQKPFRQLKSGLLQLRSLNHLEAKFSTPEKYILDSFTHIYFWRVSPKLEHDKHDIP